MQFYHGFFAEVAGTGMYYAEDIAQDLSTILFSTKGWERWEIGDNAYTVIVCGVDFFIFIIIKTESIYSGLTFSYICVCMEANIFFVGVQYDSVWHELATHYPHNHTSTRRIIVSIFFLSHHQSKSILFFPVLALLFYKWSFEFYTYREIDPATVSSSQLSQCPARTTKKITWKVS